MIASRETAAAAALAICLGAGCFSSTTDLEIGPASPPPAQPPTPTGPPVALAFKSSPATVVAGMPIAPGLRVGVVDALGRPVTTAAAIVSLTLRLDKVEQNLDLGGTLVSSTSGGWATFDNVWLRRAGSGYALIARAPGLAAASTSAMVVIPGPASRITIFNFDAPTGRGFAGVRAAFTDAMGNQVHTQEGVITVELAINSSGATLTGTTTRTAVDGAVNFDDLAVDRGGTYSLRARASGMVDGGTRAFSVQ